MAFLLGQPRGLATLPAFPLGSKQTAAFSLSLSPTRTRTHTQIPTILRASCACFHTGWKILRVTVVFLQLLSSAGSPQWQPILIYSHYFILLLCFLYFHVEHESKMGIACTMVDPQHTDWKTSFSKQKLILNQEMSKLTKKKKKKVILTSLSPSLNYLLFSVKNPSKSKKKEERMCVLFSLFFSFQKHILKNKTKKNGQFYFYFKLKEHIMSFSQTRCFALRQLNAVPWNLLQLQVHHHGPLGK